MQIALHDIRVIGYKKIYKYFSDEIINKIKKLNTEIYSYDDSPFSVLNDWGSSNKQYVEESYFGFCNLVNNYTPMVSELGADVITKRKFRNTWVKMWKNITNGLELSDEESKILSDCGIRLVYYLYLKIDIDTDLAEILSFYNLLYNWTIFSDKELNFKKNNMSHIDVISLLALSEPQDFNKFILENIH